MSAATHEPALRVLQVLGRSAGGIARHVAQITEMLDGDGLRIDVAGPPDLPVAMPKPQISLDIPDGPRGHRRPISMLRAVVRRDGYEVVHAHGLRAGIDAALACRSLDVPVLLTVHNLVRPDVSGRARAAFYKYAEPLAVGLAQRTFVVSEDIARHLRAVSPRRASKVEVLYLGVGDPPEVTRPAGEVKKELGATRLVVTVSRLSAQKNLDVMLGALALLPADVSLAVIGTGPDLQRLRVQAQALGVGGRVHWLGWLTDVADWLAAADVFCLSSNWEGVPLAAQEAILLDTPVVSTEVGGMPELIADRASGRLVPKGDGPALAGALREVLFEEGVGTRYARRAREELGRRFSTERMLTRLRESYRWAAG
ncbi:MAG: glycosyltransferase family 4 protein [Actinomycetota bacterium]